MTHSEAEPDTTTSGDEQWVAVAADEVVQRLGVDPAQGLSAGKAAELLTHNGRNALPAEKPGAGWRRFLARTVGIAIGTAASANAIAVVKTTWVDSPRGDPQGEHDRDGEVGGPRDPQRQGVQLSGERGLERRRFT